nr:hypothetical protein CFP56_37687 [Quercus suber]
MLVDFGFEDGAASWSMVAECVGVEDAHTKDELIFSVKMAYQVTVRQQQQEQGEHSSVQSDRKFWNHVWQLYIPPKVRNFAWRITG